MLPTIGKAAEVKATEAGAALKEPELIATLGVASWATIKYWITSPIAAAEFNKVRLSVNEQGDEPDVVSTNFHPLLAVVLPA